MAAYLSNVARFPGWSWAPVGSREIVHPMTGETMTIRGQRPLHLSLALGLPPETNNGPPDG